MRARVVALATRLSLAVAATVGTLLVAEWCTSWFVPAAGPDPALAVVSAETPLGAWRGHRLQPDQHTTHNGGDVSVNEWGCREIDFAETPDPGRPRVLLIGDSFVYGDGVNQRDILSYQLRREYGQANVEIVNCGQWGYNTVDTYALYVSDLYRFQPRTVLMVHTLNDATCRLDCGPTTCPVSTRRAVGLMQALRAPVGMRSAFGALVASRLDALLNGRGDAERLVRTYESCNPQWAKTQAAYLELRDFLAASGVSLRVVIFPMLLDFDTYPLGLAHERVAEFLRQAGIPFVDLLPAFRDAGIAASRLHASVIDSHPNATAYGIAARGVRREYGQRLVEEQ